MPHILRGWGPRIVVSTAAFHARVRGSVLGLGSLKETKTVLGYWVAMQADTWLKTSEL